MLQDAQGQDAQGQEHPSPSILILVLIAFPSLQLSATVQWLIVFFAAGGCLLQLIHSGESKGEFVTQTLVAIPLAYICICAYFSLFKLGNFGFYHMVSNSTYPSCSCCSL